VPSHPPSTTMPAPALAQSRCLEDFAVHVDFTVSDTVTSVRGELDAHTAPTLHNLLRGLVDSGHTALVIDLAAVTFIGAGGLGVIASTGSAVRALGGSVTLRSPTRQARRILEITGISQRVLIEDTDAPTGLRADLARVAWAPTRNDIMDAKLLGIVALASVAVAGADGVSVSIERHGRLTTVAASNDTVLRMDDHQYDTGEGPCVAAASDGADFAIDSLPDESRWPAFVPRALDEGIGSILSTPLRSTERSIGALNIYSSAAHAFGSQQRELAAVFAAHAADVVAGGDGEITDEEMDARIGEALSSRAMLSLAQGVLMARHGLTADEAAAVLHRDARGFGTTTLARAADVVASTVDNAPIAG
jgi:anti-anti-sigma factor